MSSPSRRTNSQDSSLRRALALEEACEGLDEDLRSSRSLDLLLRAESLAPELRASFAYEVACLIREDGIESDRKAEAELWLAEAAPEVQDRASLDCDEISTPGPALGGRYRILEQIGAGAMGRVYRARDEFLHREVALKMVSRRDGISTNLLVQEARAVARIEHPHIVPVYDAGRDTSGEFYLASRLIEGRSLAAILEDGRPKRDRSLRWILDLADALATAHEAGIIHRDVKPANVLIDQRGKVWLTDFGLALRRDGFEPGYAYVGTPTYMSPEQARGESHRVDGRSDLFSLGVLLYELLTGQRPHSGTTLSEMGRSLSSSAPRPPSELVSDLAPALDAVVNRCLALRPQERFPDLRIFAAALRDCLQAPEPSQTFTGPAPVIPKGIRAFDEADAGFYDSLVPGPRTLEGEPDFLTRWTRRLANSRGDAPPVIVIFGPSGSGKSSLVHAGLLPRLPKRIDARRLDAAVHRSPALLVRDILRRRSHQEAQPSDTDFPQAFAAIREEIREENRENGGGGKCLLVIDQFEQWLGAGRDSLRHEELAGALRHCDGQSLQALLVVRDDHWLAMSRLMRDLELPLVEDHNTAVVDLFDLRHARAVLEAFGRGYGQLAADRELSPDEEHFLDAAVDALAENERIVPVRLALFADMMRGRDWSTRTLSQLGGFEGLGIRYFEERVVGAEAPLALRENAEVVRTLLRSFLPPAGGALRSVVRRRRDLIQGLSDQIRGGEARDLLDALEHELRLISAVAPDALDEDQPIDPRYQLTHDFLVLAIRDWDHHRARRSRSGLAEVTLEKKSDLFALTGDERVLPAFGTWIFVLAFSNRAEWTPPQRQLMMAARRRHLRRGSFVLIAAVILAGIGLHLWRQQTLRAQDRADRELIERFLVADAGMAGGLRAQLLKRPAARVASLLSERRRTIKLRDQRALTRLDLLDLDHRPQEVKPRLLERLRRAELREALLIRDVLAQCKQTPVERIWKSVEGKMPDEPHIIRNALVLVAWDPPRKGDADLASRWQTFAPRLAHHLIISVLSDPARSRERIEVFAPLAKLLRAPVLAEFRDRRASSAQRSAAAALLARFAERDLQTLAAAIAACEPETFETLFNVARQRGALMEQTLRSQLGLSREARARANLTLALARLGRSAPLWRALADAREPDVATFAAMRARGFGISAGILFDRYRARSASTRERYHLLLALAEYDEMILKMSVRGFPEELQRAPERDEDPGLLALRGWIRSQLGMAPLPQGPPLKPRASSIRRRSELLGHEFVLIPGPATYLAGSPTDDANRQSDETLRRLQISRPFALASRETTLAQFREFAPDFDHNQLFRSPSPDCPVLRVDWHDAARYCNFLSQRAGIPREQWCYEIIPQSEGRMRPAPGALTRSGFRLPSEAEWEYCCRAGTATSRPWGNSETYLGAFAWGNGQAEERSWPVATLRPNPWGFFDLLGNAMEWCHDEYPSEEGQERDPAALRRVLRGGAFYNQPSLMRSADRVRQNEDYRSESIGFRVCRTLSNR